MAGTPQVGNAEAEGWFEGVCDETYRFTLAYLVRRTGSRSDAEDLAVETYGIAWRRLAEFRNADEPQAWLFAVASGCLQNFRRGSRRRADLEDKIALTLEQTSASLDPAFVVEQRAEVALMEAALRTLPERDQQVLTMVAYESLTYSEIGLVLGVRTTLVRRVVNRARRRLNRAMAELEVRHIPPPGHIRTEDKFRVENSDD